MLKEIAISIKENCKSAELMVLLIDERPEEVTDIEDTIGGYVISSTFEQKPEDHIHMAEFALEIAKRKVENGKDVVVLLDSITRLARAYNLTVPSSGKLLSGGFDPNALYRPKKFFGAARNTKESGSLTIIATALVDTGSRLDDVVYEEFKGTGNMELHLDRNIAEMRIYPAINVKKSSTRKDELLYTKKEKENVDKLRKQLSELTDVEATKTIISLLKKTKTNDELIEKLYKYMKYFPTKYIESILHIDPKELKINGIEGIILDLDNTIIDKSGEEIPDFEKWKNSIIENGIKIILVTNNFLKKRIEKITKKYNLEYVSFARKPNTKGLIKAQKLMGIENPIKVAVIGDQVFTDVRGGNKAGMKTILVKPLSEKKDYMVTKILRNNEKKILKKYEEYIKEKGETWKEKL